MNMDTVNQYLDAYGYGVIFIFLFFGIVGIPAPEESLLVLIGILSGQNEERLIYSILTAFAGTYVGMLTAYGMGRFFGPTVLRYGRFIGLTRERWERVSNGYMGRINRTIIAGLYIPGVRQINPYFAGMKQIPFGRYFWVSALGSALWVVPFVLLGHFAGKTFHIKPEVVPYFGLALLVLFLLGVLVKWLKRKRLEKRVVSGKNQAGKED